LANTLDGWDNLCLCVHLFVCTKSKISALVSKGAVFGFVFFIFTQIMMRRREQCIGLKLNTNFCVYNFRQQYDHLNKIIGEIEIHSVDGIKTCFVNGLGSNV
jgi:hypothetical protein